MDYQSPSAWHALYLFLRDWHVRLESSNQYRGNHQDADTSICLWMIEAITLVLEDSSFRENSETMSKALGDEELDMIIVG